MKYVKKKIIKGRPYYYFEYYLGLKEKKTYTKYLGAELPDNLREKMAEYFGEIAILVVKNLDVKYFHSIKTIEDARFKHVLRNHELFEKDMRLFNTLFYILFVLNSNRSEGSRVTQSDIERVMTRNIKPKTMIEKEVLNSIKAINFSFSSEMKWNAKSIKKIHDLLFHDIYPDFAGQYKKVNNIVGNNLTTKWEEVSYEMKQLLKWFHKNKKKMYPPQLVLEFHWRFESIHPFQDGNGRAGRILLNSFLVQQGYAPVIYFTDNHGAYCRALDKAREGKVSPLAKHYVLSVKKTERAIQSYKSVGKITGGSPKVGRWEIQKGKIRVG
jgi:Fic family protein